MESEFQNYLNSSKQITGLVEKEYPKGLILKWKTGPYAGRECFVKQVVWEEDWRNRGQIDIMIRVATRTKDGRGFMNDNDSFHRTFHGTTRNFEKVMK